MEKRKIIEIIFILIGICLIAYPIISAFVNSYTQTVCISNYQNDIKSISKEEKELKLEEAREYNNSLETEQEIDISLNTNQEEKEYLNYYNALNVGNVMAYISIPKIDVYLPIYHGVSENTLQSGVGHIEATSLPVGGKGTHCVIAGHTGLAKAKMFDNINKMQLGDEFYINVLDDILTYKVDSISIVTPDDTSSLNINPEKDYVTLVTCTPYMINTHRLLVRGERVKNSDIDSENTSDVFAQGEEINNLDVNKLKKKRIKEIIITILIFLLIFIILMIYIFRDNEEKLRNAKH